MEGHKNDGSDADGLPPPYSSPEHQANAAASAGINHFNDNDHYDNKK